MSDELVTLECPYCNAGLDIYRDTTSLTCHQCARVIRVTRRGRAIELDTIAARVMEVRPWPEFVTAESEISQIEQSLAKRREERRQFDLWVHRRRIGHGVSNAVAVVFVLGLGAWVVHDKDESSQLAMAILLGGCLAIIGVLALLGRHNTLRYEWSKRWPWGWRPNGRESVMLETLEGEIGRLEKLLSEKKQPGRSA